MNVPVKVGAVGGTCRTYWGYIHFNSSVICREVLGACRALPQVLEWGTQHSVRICLQLESYLANRSTCLFVGHVYRRARTGACCCPRDPRCDRGFRALERDDK